MGSFILRKICDVLYRQYVGLYGDDGSSVVKTDARSRIRKEKKKIIETFKKY